MRIGFTTVALCVSAATAAAAFAVSASSPALAASPGKAAVSAGGQALIDKYCTSCHGAEQVTAKNQSAAEWAETIDKMVDYGAQITPADRKKLQAFLVAHYGQNSK
jgi:cytochrome c5